MSDEKEPTAYEVIGVVGDAKYEDMQSMPPPTAYLPITQRGDHGPPSYTAIARIDGPAAPLASAVRAISARMASAMPAPTMTSMSSVLDDSLSAERLMAMLSVFFGLCAMIVTAIGLYGTLAYATARRTTEIGIRMALGARRAQVVGLVFGQNLAVMLAGTVTGLVAALLAARALASFLYGTSTHDPWVMAGSILTLGAIASAASLLPALRASRIEPMAAIRCE
jgi:predicted lysophospholipase L1 biosynthesis ABC-type transport system permease subunit